MVKIIKNDKGKRENDCVQNQPGLPLASTVNLAVVGDSHVGFLNSQSMFNTLLQRVVNNGNKRYIIFGGDDVHALGASSIQVAKTYYQQFTNILNNVLGSIPFRSSIGNWEATNRNNSRALFRQYINRYLTGYRVIPGTQGLVRHVWLDNGRGGLFSQDSLNLLSNLDPNYYYIIDFHWPLRVPGITMEIHGDHVMTQMQTNMFFNAIPSNVRNKILAIFTHHAHKFFANSVTINPNFPNTSFFVTGCSGDYACISSERGYYELNLTVQNNIATLQTIKTRVQ